MERHEWEIERVKEQQDKQRQDIDQHDDRLRALELFKETTVEKLVGILKRLEHLEKRNDRINTTFQNALITGVVGTFLSLAAWLIQRSWGA